jgi:hypothetical protein
MPRSSQLRLRFWLLALLALLGCNQTSSHAPGADPNKHRGDFESDLPNGVGDSLGRGGEVALDGSGQSGAPLPPGDFSNGDDAGRAIVEADVIQLEGDRLYALSRVAGLTVIDVSNPDALRILGRYRELPAEPFEMYLRDGVVIAMFSSWGQYVAGDADGEWQWVQTSKVVALDAADPAEIISLGSFDVPGNISDSRIVGDVLYVVGYQDGYCWGCEQDQARTAVLSLDVSDPRDMRKVDELAFDDADNQWGWNRRSITVTEQRMYVAGPEYGASQPQGSTIQVIDISDPAGDMVEGDSVEVAGQISSRWQMDEYQGVLRVISQTPQWNLAQAPRVQTFTVVSSDELQPLGSTTLVLPRPEQLQSVRFDGPRGYAVTFERTDPLFTIDLSDPAQPVQKGTLEMPGFLYHMHPRGDRLLGLGYDQGNSQGSITVSLFDVSDLSSPTMIDRVNFGGSWASLPEDQDRIHKAFKVLDEAGLILVPYSGWDYDEANAGYCGGSYSGGVKLVDFVGDTLTGRGSATVDGGVRRAILLEERLLTVSDERVQTFDIADRDAPQASGKLLLARNVERAYQLDNGSVARLSLDWWSGAPSIDFVAADAADEPNASLGALDLREALETDSLCQYSVWVRDAFARGDHIEIVYQGTDYDAAGRSYEEFYGLAIIDGSDPSAPKVLSNTTWPYDSNWWWYDGYYGYGYYGDQKSLVHTDGAIVTLETTWQSVGKQSVMHHRLRVVDLSDPSAPTSSLLELPGNHSYSGLVADGDAVLTSHFEVSDASGERARFYLDRFELSDPAQLVQAEPVNIPGALMHVDGDSGDLLTSELVRKQSQVATAEECYERYPFPQYLPDNELTWEGPGQCVGYTQRLHLVSIAAGVATLEDTLTLEDDENVRSLAAGDGVLFASMGFGGYYYGRYALADCFGPCGYGGGVGEPGELLTLAGFGKGQLSAGRITVEGQDAWYGFWGTPGVYASGKRAMLVSYDELAIVDATDAANPTLVRTEPVYGTPFSVQITDAGKALLALGMSGVQWVELE